MDKKTQQNTKKCNLQELLNEFSSIKDELFIIYKEIMSVKMLTTNEASKYDEKLTELEQKFEKLKILISDTKNQKMRTAKICNLLDTLIMIITGAFLAVLPEVAIILLIVAIFIKKKGFETADEVSSSVDKEKSLRKDIAVMIQNTSTFITAKNEKYLDYEAKNSKAMEIEQLIIESMIQSAYNITNNQDTCPLVATPIEELKLVREKNEKRNGQK